MRHFKNPLIASLPMIHSIFMQSFLQNFKISTQFSKKIENRGRNQPGLHFLTNWLTCSSASIYLTPIPEHHSRYSLSLKVTQLYWRSDVQIRIYPPFLPSNLIIVKGLPLLLISLVLCLSGGYVMFPHREVKAQLLAFTFWAYYTCCMILTSY